MAPPWPLPARLPRRAHPRPRARPAHPVTAKPPPRTSPGRPESSSRRTARGVPVAGRGNGRLPARLGGLLRTAETEMVLAADLGSGTDDLRATAPDLLRRALAVG